MGEADIERRHGVTLAQHKAIPFGPVGLIGPDPHGVEVEGDDDVGRGQRAAKVMRLARPHGPDDLESHFGSAPAKGL